MSTPNPKERNKQGWLSTRHSPSHRSHQGARSAIRDQDLDSWSISCPCDEKIDHLQTWKFGTSGIGNKVRATAKRSSRINNPTHLNPRKWCQADSSSGNNYRPCRSLHRVVRSENVQIEARHETEYTFSCTEPHVVLLVQYVQVGNWAGFMYSS